tara:strand:+ start:203 stop:451 length:249 start_codon:yes stop_codon:yes gene_type:complete
MSKVKAKKLLNIYRGRLKIGIEKGRLKERLISETRDFIQELEKLSPEADIDLQYDNQYYKFYLSDTGKLISKIKIEHTKNET